MTQASPRTFYRLIAPLLLAFATGLRAFAASPPSLVNYPGVLRDQNDKPPTGTFDVLLRFMDDPVAGNEIMIEQHAAVTANAVAVTGACSTSRSARARSPTGAAPGRTRLSRPSSATSAPLGSKCASGRRR